MDIELPFIGQHTAKSAIEAILKGETVTLKYPGLQDARLNFISGFLYRLFSRMDLAFLTEAVLVYIRENVSNCSKAIAKRIYFQAAEQDIQNRLVYEQMLPNFSEQVLGRWEDFIAENKNNNYSVEIAFQLHENSFSINIENSTNLVQPEQERIKTRLAAFNGSSNLESVLETISDSSEGAGIGLVMSLSILRNAGISCDTFRINSGQDKTTIKIEIPRHINPAETEVKFREIVFKEIESLPSFPDKIQNLIDLCNSSKSSIQEISEKIQTDPSLTAEVLKLVNSAGYMTGIKNPTITDAVKIIGLKILKDLLMVTGARNIINARYRDLEKIWEGSNRVSFYARHLLRGKSKLVDTGALAGLLFELGKIIFISLKPEMVNRIHELKGAGRIRNSSVIEEISIGISHPEVGALIAEKWKFPEPLIAAIRHQQKPLAAPAEYAELIGAINLAIKLHEAGLMRSDYYSVEPDVLAQFGIKGKADFDELCEKMKKMYELDGSAS